MAQFVFAYILQDQMLLPAEVMLLPAEVYNVKLLHCVNCDDGHLKNSDAVHILCTDRMSMVECHYPHTRCPTRI